MASELNRSVAKAWRRWDDRSTNIDRVMAYERACKAVADALGMTTSQVRDQLAEGRRRGLSYDQSVAEVSPDWGSST